ncbi:MAG TPA: DUF533 domain-containing protein [Azospirillaceae bacterium]|nr:DUF533 domain-containing protein [Azospirillaceae bacterium]
MTEAAVADAEGEGAVVDVRRGAQLAELHEVLGAKVLQGHLQNRHQLLDPPPADLGELAPEQAELMVLAMAAAAHADGRFGDRERQRLQAALATTRLDADARQRLAASVEEPPALEPLLRRVAGTPLAPRLYAVSLVAIGEGSAVELAYLDYLAARLALPADLVVRYRRRFRLPT